MDGDGISFDRYVSRRGTLFGVALGSTFTLAARPVCAQTVIVTPSDGELRIELKGNLAAMLSAATNAKRSPETGDLSLQVEMVAGAGFEPATFGL